jgi:hypothetical protein
MSGYSDIISDGGMDPRNRLDDSMYRLTVEQRNAAWREVQHWRERHDALLKRLTERASLQLVQTPLATHAQSFEAGRAAAFDLAAYSIGIDTEDGVHCVVVMRMVPGLPTVMVAKKALTMDDWK